MTFDPKMFINRELSWLAFNERVLEEAADTSVPLLERAKFAAIATSNLDEFFMVRVASLKTAIEEEDHTPDLSGLTPAQQLTMVRDRSRALSGQLYALATETLLPNLAEKGIRLLNWSEVSAEDQAGLASFFRDAVLPVLTPLAIDTARPFPLLASLTLNLAILLEPESEGTEPRLAIVQVPPRLVRLLRISGATKQSFVLLEDVVRANLSALFPGQVIREVRCIRLSRDAELELEDEGARTHLEIVERQLKQRRQSDVVRLEIEAAASPEMVTLLVARLDIDADDVYAVAGPLDLRLLIGLVELPGFDELRDPPLIPVDPLAEDDRDLFSILDQRDVLLHHPYARETACRSRAATAGSGTSHRTRSAAG